MNIVHSIELTITATRYSGETRIGTVRVDIDGDLLLAVAASALWNKSGRSRLGPAIATANSVRTVHAPAGTYAPGSVLLGDIDLTPRSEVS